MFLNILLIESLLFIPMCLFHSMFYLLDLVILLPAVVVHLFSFLYNVPVHEYTTIYLYLLQITFIVFSFFTIRNNISINILVHVFGA